MKRIFVIIAVFALVFTSCDSGNIIGGRYYGTFHNTTNGMRKYGNLSFQFAMVNDNTCMMFNNTLPMTLAAENKYVGIAEGSMLRDLLKTIPAIDSVQVCDSTETIRMMNIETEFKGNSVKADMTFTTTNENIVMVEFIGGFE